MSRARMTYKRFVKTREEKETKVVPIMVGSSKEKIAVEIELEGPCVDKNGKKLDGKSEPPAEEEPPIVDDGGDEADKADAEIWAEAHRSFSTA